MSYLQLLRLGLFALLMIAGTFAMLPVTQASDYSVYLTIPKATCMDFSEPGIYSYRGVLLSYDVSYTAPGYANVSLNGGIASYVDPKYVAMIYGDGGWNGDYFLGNYGIKFPFTFSLRARLFSGDSIFDNDHLIYGELLGDVTVTGTCVESGPAIIDEASQSNGFNPGDDRLQPDPAAPVAVYCREGGVEIYAIDSNSEGSLALKVDQKAVSGEKPAENKLIASEGNIRLYRLTTGELEVNAGPDAEGKEYVLIWDGC